MKRKHFFKKALKRRFFSVSLWIWRWLRPLRFPYNCIQMRQTTKKMKHASINGNGNGRRDSKSHHIFTWMTKGVVCVREKSKSFVKPYIQLHWLFIILFSVIFCMFLVFCRFFCHLSPSHPSIPSMAVYLVFSLFPCFSLIFGFFSISISEDRVGKSSFLREREALWSCAEAQRKKKTS